MKTLFFLLLLAGTVPASILAQTSAPAAPAPTPELNQISSGNNEIHMIFTGTLPPGEPEYILNREITGNLWNPGLANGLGVRTDATLTPGVYWTNIDNGTAAINNYQCGSVTIAGKGHDLPLSVASGDTSDSTYLYDEVLSWGPRNDPIELQNGIDSMRIFCRQHPFADSWLLYGGGPILVEASTGSIYS
jgi:hypothetical protein